MNDLRVQAESQGAEVLERDVEKLDLSIYPFELEVAGIENSIVAKAIIIATGAQALWLNAENEEKVRGRGVSTCATCDVS
jgi:thioredoxin reductase (NADPH)